MKRSDVDLDLIQAFVAVADAGSFTAASPLLQRTQSAISQKILRLEKVLGKLVFQRTSRSLQLTREGQQILNASRRLLTHYEAFLADVHTPQVLDLLRLGVSDSLIQLQLPGVLSTFREKHPNIQIELTSGASQEILDAYKRGELDVVIVGTFRPLRIPNGRIICKEQLVWVTQAEYNVDPALPAQLVAMRPPCVYHEVMRDALEAAHREWVTVCTVNSLNTLQAAVLGGLGVTILGRSCLREGMKVVPPSKNWPSLPVLEISLLGESQSVKRIIDPLAELIVEVMTGNQQEL